MGKKTIFFDLDDTLYDRSVPYCSAFAAFFGGKYADKVQTAFERTMLRGYEVFEAAHTGQMTMEAMHIYRHQTGLRDVGIEITPEQALRMQALYAEEQRHISLTPVMEEILTFCRAHFAAMGVIDKRRCAVSAGQAEKPRCGAVVPARAGAYFGRARRMKPGPEIFRIAEQAAGARAEDCVYVGDSYSQDVAGAGGCGWETVWLNRRGDAAGELAPTYCVKTEEDLLAYLKRMA